jgi:hypothetical protein
VAQRNLWLTAGVSSLKVNPFGAAEMEGRTPARTHSGNVTQHRFVPQMSSIQSMQIRRPTLALAALSLAALPIHAEKNAALKPVLGKEGKSLTEDSFDSAQLGKLWAPNKGTWQVKDGALAGSFKESDHHPAVLLLGVPNHNSIIRFSFKIDDSKGFNLSYNSDKGHLFRVVVTGDGLTVNRDRNKKDPKSKSVAMAKASGIIAPGEWHTLLVEVLGGKVSIQTDTGLKASVENSELNVDKTGYRFVTGGSVMLDDLKAWQAE